MSHLMLRGGGGGGLWFLSARDDIFHVTEIEKGTEVFFLRINDVLCMIYNYNWGPGWGLTG